MELTLIVPDGHKSTCTCDALRFTIPDGAKKQAGGSYGIHPGHTDALMAISAGLVVATLEKQTVLHCRVGDGLAMVTGESVTILTDHVQSEN